MAVISFMSTNAGSAEHSSRILTPLLRWIRPDASPEEFALVHLLVRKAAHLTEYAILSMLAFRALRHSRRPTDRPWSNWRVGILAFLIAGAYSASDEFHQSFVPGRTGAIGDVLIDCCGAALGLSLMGLIYWMTFRADARSTKSTTASPI